MIQLELALVGASTLKNGNARYQCSLPIGDENDDVEPLGELPVASCLGVTSLPFPKDANGHAEAIVARGMAGRKAFVIGARDTRSGKVVGKMDPGDTVVHSTDPDETAQVRLQGKKKSASLIVKGKDGKHLIVVLDGENGKLQIMAKGAAIEIDESGDISLLGKGGGGILIQGNNVCINGVLKLPGMPPGMQIMCAPMTGPVVTIPVTSVAPAPSAGILQTGTWMPCLNVAGYT